MKKATIERKRRRKKIKKKRDEIPVDRGNDRFVRHCRRLIANQIESNPAGQVPEVV